MFVNAALWRGGQMLFTFYVIRDNKKHSEENAHFPFDLK